MMQADLAKVNGSARPFKWRLGKTGLIIAEMKHPHAGLLRRRTTMKGIVGGNQQGITFGKRENLISGGDLQPSPPGDNDVVPLPTTRTKRRAVHVIATETVIKRNQQRAFLT